MLKNGEKISVLLTIFVIITIIAMGMFLIFKDDLFVFRNNKPIYTRNEPVLAELKFGSTKGELIKKLGNPKKVKKEWWGAYGDYVEFCYYDWGTIWLAPGNESDLSKYIIYAEINKKGIKGPRGIEVGDSYKKVLNKFRYSPEKIGDNKFLYCVISKTKDNGLKKIQPTKFDGIEQFGGIVYNKKGEVESIYYQDTLYYGIEFKISKGRVKQIVAYHHDN